VTGQQDDISALTSSPNTIPFLGYTSSAGQGLGASTTWKLTLWGPKFTLQEDAGSLKAIGSYLLTPLTSRKHR